MIASLNAEQHQIYDELLSTVQEFPHTSPRQPFFLEGRPGRGKTYLVNCLATALRSQRRIPIIVGSSGLAASLYERGRTAHYFFGIPVTEVCLLH